MSRRFLVIYLLFAVFSVNFWASAAENSCPWMQTYGRKTEDIIKDIEKKSGKAPTVACGAGADFKVCHSCAERISDADWAKVATMLTLPSYRNWHQMWHMSVGNMAMFASNMPQPKPDGSKPFHLTEKLKPEDINGESFFYFHRLMIRSVQANLAAMGLPCVAPWTKLPEKADDPVWPTQDAQARAKLGKVCKTFNEADYNRFEEINQQFQSEKNASDAKFQAELASIAMSVKDRTQLFITQDQKQAEHQAEIGKILDASLLKNQWPKAKFLGMQDCVKQVGGNMTAFKFDFATLTMMTQQTSGFGNLSKSSLADIGNQINGGWHGFAHFLYNVNDGPNCAKDLSGLDCRNMLDPRSSMVNQEFFKIHSLVDHHVDSWLAMHGFERAEEDCTGLKNCYTWKKPFIGMPPDYVVGMGCNLTAVPMLMGNMGMGGMGMLPGAAH